MAIVQMQRINICALKKNRKAILERLQELGAMEVDIRLEDEELCEKQDVSSSRSTFERRSQTADQALHILDEYAPEKKGMLDSLAGKPLVDKESLAKAAAQQRCAHDLSPLYQSRTPTRLHPHHPAGRGFPRIPDRRGTVRGRQLPAGAAHYAVALLPWRAAKG